MGRSAGELDVRTEGRGIRVHREAQGDSGRVFLVLLCLSGTPLVSSPHVAPRGGGFPLSSIGGAPLLPTFSL